MARAGRAQPAAVALMLTSQGRLVKQITGKFRRKGVGFHGKRHRRTWGRSLSSGSSGQCDPPRSATA
jgi:hypothetical protein